MTIARPPAFPFRPAPVAPPLRLVSLLSPNARAFHAALADPLGEAVGARVEFDAARPWSAALDDLDAGRADLGALCGLLFARRPDLDLLAAPVPLDPRAGGRPVYFADVVVRAGHRARGLADLRGARWAYNDPGSFSGRAALLGHLADLGEDGRFFGHLAVSGGHLSSLDWVAQGRVDAAAIDSHVLAVALRHTPALARDVRVVASLGPFPAPPLVARRDLPAPSRSALREALLGLHLSAPGREALHLGGFARLAPADPADYAALVRIAARADALPRLPREGRAS